MRDSTEIDSVYVYTSFHMNNGFCFIFMACVLICVRSAKAISVPTKISLSIDHTGHIAIDPESIDVTPSNQSLSFGINVRGLSRGHYEITANATPANSLE